ncbi:hypothetical protein [Nocardia sp. R7R-8]|uniref:hypothetical protein n=1 Tax=Nocardia sp. R7R-8 TaxID=3459304 RepID=UPI00403DC079
MFRRFTTHAPTGAPPVDDLVAGALPDRVQIAHERLAHQDDPALLEALSERELAASRELAELVRDYERHEKRARIQAAADAAERVRRTAAELAEREAADLLRAAQAIGEQRHSSSPHAKVARLHQRKPRVLGLLAGVVAFSMLFSAVTVQQNIAPTGGATNPMFWLSYGLEALISAVLVALMLSTGDTAEWGVIDRLWQVYTVEGVLLTASIALNTFPYFRSGDVAGIGIHAIAPIMIGVALVTHRLVAERYGRAIEQATAAVPDHEDLQERLAALTQVGGAGNQILPSILMEPTAPAHRASEPTASGQEGAVVPAADASQQQQRPPAGQQPGTEERVISPAAPAPELTELWLATTPLPVVERVSAVAEGGPEAAADASPDEAVLDARLAAAVRQTLDRIRSGKQPEPPTADGSEPPGFAQAADEHGARGEVAEAGTEPTDHGAAEAVTKQAARSQTLESSARDTAEAVTEQIVRSQTLESSAGDTAEVVTKQIVRSQTPESAARDTAEAVVEHVERSEAAQTHPESNGRAPAPIGTSMAQHYIPGADGNDHSPRMEQVTPAEDVNPAAITQESDDTAAATAPHPSSEPQLSTR